MFRDNYIFGLFGFPNLCWILLNRWCSLELAGILEKNACIKYSILQLLSAPIYLSQYIFQKIDVSILSQVYKNYLSLN